MPSLEDVIKKLEDFRSSNGKFPTTQSLANHMGVSQDVVQEAKRLILQKEGLALSVVTLPSASQTPSSPSVDPSPGQVTREVGPPKEPPPAPSGTVVSGTNKSEEIKTSQPGSTDFSIQDNSQEAPGGRPKGGNGWKVHIHNFLSPEILQILFSIVAVLDIIRHYYTYMTFFTPSMGEFMSHVSSIINSIAVATIPATVVFSFKKRNPWLATFLILTYIPCVSFSVYVNSYVANQHYTTSDEIKSESIADTLRANRLYNSLTARIEKIDSQIESYMSESEGVRTKLSNPSDSNEYKSAIKLINANDKKVELLGNERKEKEKELKAIEGLVDLSVVEVEKDETLSTMNFVQSVFLDMIGIATVLVAFFL